MLSLKISYSPWQGCWKHFRAVGFGVCLSELPLNIWGTSNGECHAETPVSDSLFVTPVQGGGPAPPAPLGLLEESACIPVPSPQEAPAAAGPAFCPHPRPESSRRRTLPGEPAGLGSPGRLPTPQTSRVPGLPRRKPVPSPVESPGAIPVPRQTPRGEHSPSCSARPARLRLGLAAGGAGVAVWPCGPVALWPGRGAERGPHPPSARPSGSPGPAPASCPAPRRPAAAAARATVRRRHVTGPRGRCGPRDTAGRRGRGLRPLRGRGARGSQLRGCCSHRGTKNPRKVAHVSCSLGAPRVAVSRDPRAAARRAGSLGIPRSPAPPAARAPWALATERGGCAFSAPWVWPASPGQGEPCLARGVGV